MTAIYPPQGPQDNKRRQSVKREERDYLVFCLEFCSTILARRPEQSEALELAANHFTELGYFHDGLRLDERLALLRPTDPGVLYNLACSYSLTGKVDDAVRTLAKAVECGYDNYRHMASDRDLEGVRSNPRFLELLGDLQRR